MNEFLINRLKVDLATVIASLAEELIEVDDLMHIVITPPDNEEDLMDFIDRDDIQQLYFVIKTVKSLTKHLSPTHMHALRVQLATLT
jgi:hypothetical protein